MPSVWRFLSRKLPHSERGAVAMVIGLSLIVIIGMAALGSEIVYVLLKHREMQSAADSSALSGATALTAGYPTDFRLQARSVASVGGFTDGVAGTAVTVNNPPLSGPYAGSSSAVEVIIAQPQSLSLISLFRSGTINVGARAVAVLGASTYCILALDSSASGAITLSNNAIVSNPNCGVAANSSSNRALVLNNNAVIDGPVRVVGNWSVANGAGLDGGPNVQNAAPAANPYANVQLQSIPSCTSQSGSSGSNVSVHLTPGHFCSGWNFGNSVSLTLAAGSYYVDQKLAIGNSATITGTGVTLVINGNYAMSLGNGAAITLSAPTSGAYSGIAILGLSNASTSITQDFSNNVTVAITGAIDIPRQTVKISNNGATPCTQLVARVIDISNNVNFNNRCSGTGVSAIGSTPAQLVE
jgi:hypothetical protein